MGSLSSDGGNFMLLSTDCKTVTGSKLTVDDALKATKRDLYRDSRVVVPVFELSC